MYHSAFRTAQIMPVNNAQTIPPTKTLSVKPLHSPVYRRPPVSGKLRRVLVVFRKPPRKVLVAKCSTAAAEEAVDGTVAVLERCFRGKEAATAVVRCKKGSGGKSGGVGQATLEKSKVEKEKKNKKLPPLPPEPETGGDGGDIGKKIYHGGGDGGDDDDDDDYFDDFDDGDEGGKDGVFRRRLVFKELFDRKFVDAVLNEWQRTITDLPNGLIEACEKGLVSSALMVKLLAINARPTTTRFISRTLPQEMSRAFIGRMLADPAFLYKLLLEQAATIGCSVWWELKNRKERIKEEWDLALINVLTTTACNAIVLWSLAPCRSYGSTLQNLPNNIFEKSYPCREFNLQNRIQSFLYKTVVLGIVGVAAGAAHGTLSNLCASKKDRLSVTIPTVRTSSLGYMTFLGLDANLRYQLLCGVDRTMMNYFDVIGVTLFCSTALRLLNVLIGERLRTSRLGIEADPLAHSNHLLNTYNSRPSEPKNGVVFGLGLLGIKQGQGDSAADGEAALPQARRKRIVKRRPETGGDGGDIGKKIYHGGGDGGDDDDDDDYFDDFDDGDEGGKDGVFRRRLVFKELFDRKFVDAVLNEWQRTITDLPNGLIEACEKGLVSSALMVKLLAINARPTTTRFISRTLPQEMSRAFIGRMLADPAFLYKLLLEQAATIGCSVWWELKNRKERIKEEWDLALINVLTTTACNAIVLWSLAPCRSYGSTLQNLPNNIFEKSYPCREFNLQNRIQSFLYKTVVLGIVGVAAGAAHGTLSNLCASKKDRLSVTIPTVRTSSLGYMTFLGLDANLRYQLLCGVDRTMMNYFDVIGVTLFCSTALRLLNVLIGERLRTSRLGIEADPLAHSNHLLNTYNSRPSEPKNGVVFGLGLLGIKQGQGDSAADGEAALPQARRKRIVKRRVAS
ncbi:hypothetical protein Vadar_023421 [Vaccinium darrowii]|uniref:Uncharacterized protein n=1 Tax=Vaccinium darrowii TaxID=229202 RepID=A0ACB7X3A0_9ERIC|nr:hypothetical protein Vadar_023421 [Vaccinium darrowii]